MQLRSFLAALCALTLLAPLGVDAAKKKKAKSPVKTAPAAPEAGKPGAGKVDPGKPAEPKADAKPAETKPAEPKPGDSKPAAATADGKKVFLDQKCTKCHKVSALGIAAAAEKDTIVDLSGVGGQRDAGWFKKWLNKELDKESRAKPGEKVKHKAAWKGSDAELDTLIAWLKGLTAKAK